VAFWIFSPLLFNMGLQASPYKDILIPLYIIPHLMIFFKVLFSFSEPFSFPISI